MENSKLRGYLCRILAIVCICIAIGYIALGYFISFTDNDGEPRDGLGRLLDDVPGGFSLIVSQWSGYVWFFFDCIILLGMVLVIDKLFVKSKTYLTGTRNVDF